MCELFSEEANKKLIIFLNNRPNFHWRDEERFADFVYQSILDNCRLNDYKLDKFKEYLKNNSNSIYKLNDYEANIWTNSYKEVAYLIDMIMRTFQNYGEIIAQIYNIEERY